MASLAALFFAALMASANAQTAQATTEAEARAFLDKMDDYKTREAFCDEARKLGASVRLDTPDVVRAGRVALAYTATFTVWMLFEACETGEFSFGLPKAENLPAGLDSDTCPDGRIDAGFNLAALVEKSYFSKWRFSCVSYAARQLEFIAVQSFFATETRFGFVTINSADNSEIWIIGSRFFLLSMKGNSRSNVIDSTKIFYLSFSDMGVKNNLSITYSSIGSIVFARTNVENDISISNSVLNALPVGYVGESSAQDSSLVRRCSVSRRSEAVEQAWQERNRRSVQEQSAQAVQPMASPEDATAADIDVWRFISAMPASTMLPGGVSLAISSSRVGGALKINNSTIHGDVSLTKNDVRDVDLSDSCFIGYLNAPDLNSKGSLYLSRSTFASLHAPVHRIAQHDLYGMRIEGSIEANDTRFDARVNLYRLDLKEQLYATRSVWRGGVALHDSRIGGYIDWSYAVFQNGASEEATGIAPANVPCDNSPVVVMCRTSVAEIFLGSARVVGDFSAWSARIERSIAFNGATLLGSLVLQNATIGAHLEGSGSRSLRDILAVNARVGGRVLFYDVADWQGDFRFGLGRAAQGFEFGNIDKWKGRIQAGFSVLEFGAEMTNIRFEPPDNCDRQDPECANIDLRSARLTGPLHLDNTDIATGARLRNARIEGAVRLAGTVVRGPVDFSLATIQSLETYPEGCRAPKPDTQAKTTGAPDGQLAIAKGGRIDLSGANAGYLGLTTLAARPYDPETKARSKTEFAGLGLSGATFSLRGPPDCQPADLLRHRADDLQAFLRAGMTEERGGYDPQPYEQMAKALLDIGKKKDAEDILQAKFEHRESSVSPLREGWLMAPWNLNFDWFLLAVSGPLIGYGLATEKAFLWWLGLVAMGTLMRLGAHRVFWRRLQNSLGWRSDKQPWRLNAFRVRKSRATLIGHAWIYSMCHAIPIVTDLYKPNAPFLRTPDETPPGIGPVEAHVYFIFHKLLAFVLVTLAVAGMAGLIK